MTYKLIETETGRELARIDQTFDWSPMPRTGEVVHVQDVEGAWVVEYVSYGMFMVSSKYMTAIAYVYVRKQGDERDVYQFLTKAQHDLELAEHGKEHLRSVIMAHCDEKTIRDALGREWKKYKLRPELRDDWRKFFPEECETP